jgi:hypothetical protein
MLRIFLANARHDFRPAPSLLERQLPAFVKAAGLGAARWLWRRPSRPATIALKTMAMRGSDTAHATSTNTGAFHTAAAIVFVEERRRQWPLGIRRGLDERFSMARPI